MADVWVNCFTFAPLVDVFHPSDTLRGGGQFVAFTLEPIIDTSRDASLLSTALPGGWSAIGDVTPTSHGVVLSAGPGTGASSSLLVPFSDYARYDASIDVELLLPTDIPSSPVELIALTTTLPGGAGSARIGFRTTPNGRFGVYGEVRQGAVIDQSGFYPVLDPFNFTWTLRLVRNGLKVYGLIGTRDRRSNRFTQVAEVFTGSVNSTVAGTMSIVTQNSSSDVVTRARVHDYIVESHASINGRLVLGKVVRSGKQIHGVVPAAPSTELGAATIEIFGMFGAATSTLGFEYVLPPSRTVGNEIVGTIKIFSDVAIRD